ncbi:hypothetical protein L195_g063589, partial [Trifolium pratense]
DAAAASDKASFASEFL